MTINVENIKSKLELHHTFKEVLNFPDYYGMNWDAFWDTITSIIEMPEVLTIQGLNKLKTELPQDAEILESIIDEYNILGKSLILIQ